MLPIHCKSSKNWTGNTTTKTIFVIIETAEDEDIKFSYSVEDMKFRIPNCKTVGFSCKV